VSDLSDPIKHRIVLALARFEAPADIVRALALEDIETDPKQIGRYDPTRPYYAAGDKWRDIFDVERKKYLTDVQAVPIANQAFRLNALQQSYDTAVRTKNRMLANATLRQAAEEVGGALTNERNVTMNRSPLGETPPEERRAMLADVITSLIGEKDPPGTQAAPKAVQ
jgi:hypothetical protein